MKKAKKYAVKNKVKHLAIKKDISKLPAALTSNKNAIKRQPQ